MNENDHIYMQLNDSTNTSSMKCNFFKNKI